jgi:hypothetical protein
MASYLVLTPELRNGHRDDDRTVFVRDGFAFLAFILPVPWLLVQRLWFEAGLVLAATIAISMVGSYTGHEDMAAIVTLLLSLLVGFEANSWRAARLERKGFEPQAVVAARNVADAEIVYFHGDDFVAEPVTAAEVRTRLSLPPVSPKPALGGMVGLVSHRGEN